jgi:hypothetical protein
MLRRILSVVVVWSVLQWVGILVFRKLREGAAEGRRHFLLTQGGSEFRPVGDDLKDSMVSVLMGGMVLDLRSVRLKSRPVVLDTLVIMGGLQVVVPSGWHVRLDVQPIMGGARDRRAMAAGPVKQPDIVLTGRVVMGGIDVASEVGQWRKG